MSERSKNPAQNVANALNQLCAASVHCLTELIGDYFQDEEFVQSESESSRDEEEDKVLPALAGDFVDIAHPDNVRPGVVTARKEHDSLESTTFQILKNPDNLPPAALCPLDLPPPGLDTIRQAYLHDIIRQYCDEHAHDITCPKPTKKRRT